LASLTDVNGLPPVYKIAATLLQSHAGRGRPAVLGDARAHPPDRGQGAEEAEAPEPIKDS